MDHEVLDNAMEVRSFVADVMLSTGESDEVLHSFGCGVSEQSQHDPTQWLPAHRHVKPYFLGHGGRVFGLKTNSGLSHTRCEQNTITGRDKSGP